MNVKFAIEAQVIKTLCDCFEVGRRKIECSSLLVEDLNVDSMSIVEIVMALNAVFDVELSAVEVSDWRAVADICRSVESAKASAALT
ncbi:acyl carrier protein [Pseudomonas sp. MAG733B]|uniref:acyl carrier protein n=1 Tax=Pseudomonas sp. MAG733B TaxID=3122079 RepID=UPI0030D52CBC